MSKQQVQLKEKELSTIEFYKEQVKPYLNENGWFPDAILGDSIWPLSYCHKHYIGNDLWWSFED